MTHLTRSQLRRKRQSARNTLNRLRRHVLASVWENNAPVIGYAHILRELARRGEVSAYTIYEGGVTVQSVIERLQAHNIYLRPIENKYVWVVDYDMTPA